MTGPRGPAGERGAPGLSVPVRWALVFLFALSVILGALNLFWTAHEVHVSAAAIKATQHREQVLQQQAGAVLGEKLCATFGRLAALAPPASPAVAGPVLAYLQAQHDALDRLGADLGCRAAAGR